LEGAGRCGSSPGGGDPGEVQPGESLIVDGGLMLMAAEANKRLGLRPVGVIADPSAAGVETNEPWYLGPWSSAREIAQQRGLADPRLSAQDQHATLARPHAFQQPVQRLALAASATQA
jgi:hypothetical protein